jgi:histidine triad (HIT) family protein
MDCIFCGIAQGKEPATIVHQDDTVVAFEDLRPQAPTHVLIIPREHVASVDALDDARADLAGKLLLAARDIARQCGLERSGYRVVTNVGRSAGQTVLHLHLHLLGGRGMTWPPG